MIRQAAQASDKRFRTVQIKGKLAGDPSSDRGEFCIVRIQEHHEVVHVSTATKLVDDFIESVTWIRFVGQYLEDFLFH